MSSDLIAVLETHPYIWAAAFVIMGIGLLFLLKYIATRQLTRYLHKAKQEAREMAQISYLNPHPLIQISADGRILFANPSANAAFPDLMKKGMGHAALSGLLDDFGSEDHRAREIAIGDKIYHQTIAPVMRGDHHDLVIYCYDISQRKVYEESLRASEKRAETAQIEAERANKARGDFLANMSHELRTPMNGIIGLSDMLLDTPLKDEQHTSLSAINQSSRHLLDLLNDLLDFSKIEADELSIERIAFRPADILLQIDNLHTQVAQNKNLHLTTSCADAVPEFLMGDPSRLLQILNNLVSNALKFTHEGCVGVNIDGIAQADSAFVLRIEIRDTGIGIPADKHEAVFTKFQQAEPAANTVARGSVLRSPRIWSNSWAARLPLRARKAKAPVLPSPCRCKSRTRPPLPPVSRKQRPEISRWI
jgi:signal transduction histidine kinase